MKTQCKWEDFYYKHPEPLSQECMEMLMEIQADKKDRLSLYKDWNQKYWKEIAVFRDTALSNCSNFGFLLKFLGGVHSENAKKVLDSFVGNPGFLFFDGKYICNYKKALAMFETKTFQEVEAKPVYGGAYE